MPLKFSIRLEGDAETQMALKRLRSNIQVRVNRRSLDEAARTGVRLAKGNLPPQRTGLLKKAMAFKAKQSGHDRGYRVVGADRSFKTKVSGWFGATSGMKRQTVVLSGKNRKGMPVTKSIARAGVSVTSGLALDPAKYAHLVEGGRKMVRAPGRATAPNLSSQGPGSMRGIAKALFFRVTGKGGNSQRVFAKFARAVKAHAFMKPASESLKRLIPSIVQRQLQRAA